MKTTCHLIISLILFALFLGSGTVRAEDDARPADPAKIKSRGGYCLDCHKMATPGIYRDWVESSHAALAIGCIECHRASQASPMASLHQGKFYISALVPKKVCAKCHRQEAGEYSRSAHARARTLLEKMPEDDPRFPLVEPFRESGFAECSGCHGGVIAATEGQQGGNAWMSAGAEPVYPDGSRGSCAVCHASHRFAVAEARQPEACTGCHRGRHYPEAELYAGSAHGRMFTQRRDDASLETAGHLLDVAAVGAPSCGLCHMNGSGVGLLTDHQLGTRLSQDLLAPVGTEEKSREGQADEKRQAMLNVCAQCHSRAGAERYLAEADRQLLQYRKEVVVPGIEAWRERLEKTRYDQAAHSQGLREYGAFLAKVKRYGMNLYMGRMNTRQR